MSHVRCGKNTSKEKKKPLTLLQNFELGLNCTPRKEMAYPPGSCYFFFLSTNITV